MALKFLNKKGWHTGSLRNIENVWKAEQKHEAEQRKLEELRKQILQERERDEFRQLQQQAGIIPAQERLEFLYDSGLSVGNTSSSEGFKAVETLSGSGASALAPPQEAAPESAPASANQVAVPGALFEDKPQSANDAWRKLHTDPLLMIRQREQEALARIKNNPVKMAMIRKSVESKKHDNSQDREHKKVKSKHKKHSSSKHHSDSESESHEERDRKRKKKHRKERRSDFDSDSDSAERERKRKMKSKKKEHYSESDSDGERERRKVDNKKEQLDSDDDSRGTTRHHRHSHKDHESAKQYSDRSEDTKRSQRGYEKSKYEDYRSNHRNDKSSPKAMDHDTEKQYSDRTRDTKQSGLPPKHDSFRRRGKAPQLTEEERAARLREMQMDAEVHEEQRWKRLKKADADDALEASQAGTSRGKSFLHLVQKNVYGAEKGGSSTIEESVRRRTHFLQGRSADDSNAFRR